MRKLTYDIFKNGVFVKNVKTYSEAVEAKKNGFMVKDKMVEAVERLFIDCYKDGKLIKTIHLNTEKKEAKEAGFEIKYRFEWVEV